MSASNKTSIQLRAAKAVSRVPQTRDPSERPVPANVISDAQNSVRMHSALSPQPARAAVSELPEIIESDDDDEVESGVAGECPETDSSRGVRVRNYVITYYPGGDNPVIVDPRSSSPIDPSHYVNYFIKPTHKQFTFYATCLEVSPTTGRLHGHLYVELKEGQTITWLKNQLGTNHIKAFVRKGTQKQARDYVYKVGEYTSKAYTALANMLFKYGCTDARLLKLVHPQCYGVMKKQGERTDLDRFVDYAMNGLTHKEFLATEQGSGLRYFKYFNDATEVFDGTHRSATIRANKRTLYDRYCEECHSRGEAPVPFYEFDVDADPVWNKESRDYSRSLLRGALEQRSFDEEEHIQGVKNKLKVHGGSYKDPKDTTKQTKSDDDSDDESD